LRAKPAKQSAARSADLFVGLARAQITHRFWRGPIVFYFGIAAHTIH
jgi:hypothetical protein